MDKRVLIAYATHAGSTREVSEEIGKILVERGFEVDVTPVEKNPPVSRYRYVLVGSPVYGSKWRAEAVEFVAANQQALSRVAVAFFSVCLAGIADDENKRAIVYGPLRQLVPPVAEALFAGKVDRRGASLFLPGWAARIFPMMDFRKWDIIRAWARTLFAAAA